MFPSFIYQFFVIKNHHSFKNSERFLFLKIVLFELKIKTF